MFARLHSDVFFFDNILQFYAILLLQFPYFSHIFDNILRSLGQMVFKLIPTMPRPSASRTPLLSTPSDELPSLVCLVNLKTWWEIFIYICLSLLLIFESKYGDWYRHLLRFQHYNAPSVSSIISHHRHHPRNPKLSNQWAWCWCLGGGGRSMMVISSVQLIFHDCPSNFHDIDICGSSELRASFKIHRTHQNSLKLTPCIGQC